MPLAPGTRLGAYELVAPLGAGGMGEVWVARDLRLDRRVALKFIHEHLAHDPDARARFEREARALAALDHPYVGAVHGVEEVDGRVFMVLAFIDGRSLQQVLSDGPLPLERARVLIPRIAEGLAAAHARGIVHRDMKAANIVVASGDVPKIVDFGIALRGNDTRLTQTGVYSGTMGYTAPEVYKGALADARSDVFSLGVVFHEMLAGRRPFARENSAAEMHAIVSEAPPPLPAEARALEPVVRRCLEKEPARRYADAGELAAALHGGSVGAAPRRAPKFTAWIAVALAVAVALGAWWMTRDHGASPPPSIPGAPAVPGAAAAKRAVAVLEFENVTGDPALDWMKRGAAELVSSALVQSPELDVFDAQRLGDLRANENGAVLNNAFLAKHGITRAMSGTIMRSGNQLQILGRIVDTADGRPVSSYTASGAADSGLFHVVGRLIPDLQVALEVNLTGDKEAEGWLREITTTSADAYRLYLRAHQALLASHWKEAASAYEKALDLDSTFVAARSELAGAYWNLGDDKNLELTRAAMRRLRPRADHRGQLRIDLQEAVVGDDPPGIVRAASELAQLYPENRFFTYLLGRGYYRTHQWRRCIDTLRPLVDQSYSWAYTYVLSARSSMQLGDTAAALAFYQKGFEVTKAEPELAYPYAQLLHSRRDWKRGRAVVEAGLRSPTLAEGPIAEGELRLELAKNLSANGDAAHAREQLLKASPLIPKEDEARADADSMLAHFGIPR
jgi:tRNA A-37 threonylcarbamoyl transferase component Bud32/TolB-like protein